MFKLALNAGHGYETPGKRCLKSIDPDETREYALNKRIADKIEAKLSEYGDIEILRIDTGEDISISKRADKANRFGADFYLAIHHNAGINGGTGGGAECYVYLKVDDLTKAWQKEIYEASVAANGLKGNRATPLKKADLGECRETKMPAVLLECGFMDSTNDTPIILGEDFAEKTANGIVAAIIARSGISKKAVPVNAPAAVGQTAKTVAEIANEVILGKWGNGQERKDRLAAAGYNYSEIQQTVNAILGVTPKKTTEQLAKEVIAGKWGNGKARKENLAAAGYNYTEIQSAVNRMLK